MGILPGHRGNHYFSDKRFGIFELHGYGSDSGPVFKHTFGSSERWLLGFKSTLLHLSTGEHWSSSWRGAGFNISRGYACLIKALKTFFLAPMREGLELH